MTVRKLIAIVLSFVLTTAVLWADDAASRVVLLVNADDPDSLRIAEYYAKRRGVPRENIVSLSMPIKETITWRDFVLGIWQPLQDELVKREWIDGIAMNLFDDFGRRKMAFSGHRISYLVVCRGVPLRISNDPSLLNEQKGQLNRAQFKTNESAVDSELSLLAVGNYNINAFVHNPLYRQESPSSLLLDTVIKVSRLDGPEADGVIAMIDSTLTAEKNGLMGRAYVDIRGPYKQGEVWLDRTAKVFESLHFDTEINLEKGTFPESARFDAPALYAGWYTGTLNGPFALPEFRLAPGAIAIHIHSFSAQTLRSDHSSWCGPLLARGAVATTGAVFEPYLEFMHHPDLLFKALSQGKNLGDAAYYALPALSWQNVLVGDPLYQPFRRSLAEQWSHRDDVAPRLAAYVVLREMRRLQAAGQADEAVQLARKEQRDRPSLPVGVALAAILTEQGDKVGAARAVGFAEYLKRVSSDDWALLLSTTDYLAAAKDFQSALKVYRNLLADKRVPTSLRLTWLESGITLANTAGKMQQSISWEREKTQLTVTQAQKK